MLSTRHNQDTRFRLSPSRRGPFDASTTVNRALIGFLSMLLAFAAFSFASPAEAQAQTVSVEVRVIVGSNGGGTDAALSGLESRLQRQFRQFSGFSQHGMRRFSLSVGQSQSVSVPGGQTATIQLVSASGGEHELRISVPGGGTTMRTRGGIFFVGGAQVPGGTLILMIAT